MQVDPNGLEPSQPGAKLDAGKPQPSLMFEAFPLALLAVSGICTYGAKKYSRGGWQHVPNGIDRYTDAMLRHMLDTRFDDPESGLPHAAHAAWNALARLELMLREKPCPATLNAHNKPYRPCVVAEYKPCNNCGDCR